MRRPPRRAGHGADDRLRRRRGRGRRPPRLRARRRVMTATRDPGPLIVTPSPGPRARAVIERMRAVEGAGPRTGGTDPPLVVESASGSIVVDPDGNHFV